MLKKIVVLALCALTLLPATASAASLPTSTTVTDGKQTGKGYDITKMALYSASPYEPASVTVTFAKPQAAGDGVIVWFNLDTDAQPDVVLAAAAGSEYAVLRTTSWAVKGKDIMAKNCFRPSLYGNTASIEFSPNCFGKAPYIQVSAQGIATGRTGVTGSDYAPGKNLWSKKVQATMAAPAIP